MVDTQEITCCEVCNRTSLRSVLNLGMHPLCDDLIQIGSSQICTEYPIEILFCETCRTAHQRFQVPKRTLFPQSYHYRSRHTADVLNGMAQLVARTESLAGGLTGKTVVDIGCNDGSLLLAFREKGARVIGIEPTGAWEDAAAQGIDVYNAFFDKTTAEAVVARHGKPDLVTFTNVFAHIEDLSGLLGAMEVLIGSQTLVVIENHYMGAVLEKNQFDTFYHEHPRTYSLSSFHYIAQRMGLTIKAAEFPGRYGGNIRVFMSAGADSMLETGNLQALLETEQSFGERFLDMQEQIARWCTRKKDVIATHARRYGPLPAKAFPGRAAILLRLLEADEHSFYAAYEKPASAKIGHCIPGTRIPILSDVAIGSVLSEKPVLINLAWHISQEIRSYMQQSGYEGQIIDIIAPEDFNG